MLTNQTFCYWLQGYFEISSNPKLTRSKIKSIETKLESIEEPLGLYTSWLKEAIEAIRKNDYRQSIIELFTDHIQQELNQIFIHEIDNSYDTELSAYYLHQVHNGTINNEVRES